MARRVLLKFSHGLGDCVQFSVVLKHLRRYHSDTEYDVVVGRGKEAPMIGLAKNVYIEGGPRPPDDHYADVKWIGWYENYNGYEDRPNTKITNSLQDEFNVPYDPELAEYRLVINPEDKKAAGAYLESIGCTQRDGKYNVVVFHYEGNTSTGRKNLRECDARVVCRAANAAGCKVLLLDWDHRSPVPDGVNVITPACGPGDIWGGFGSGSASMIAALVEKARLFIGIDSGPGKVASAVHSTTSIIVWTGHHPIQFHDPSPSTLHLIPVDHTELAPVVGRPELVTYFYRKYKSHRYTALDYPGAELNALISSYLTGNPPERKPDGLVKHGDFWVREDNFEQDCVIIDDVFYGDCYRTSLYDLKQWETLVDVGAHIGVFARVVHHMNPKCQIVCIEVCPENIPALRANVGDFATILQGACSYSADELALLNAVRPNCESTGGSVVVRAAELNDPNSPLRQEGYKYWADARPIQKYTVEEAMSAGGFAHVDCLKLDCEGGEYDIMESSPSVQRLVRFVFGEYHDSQRWLTTRTRICPDWQYGVFLESHGRGLFHLINPRFDKSSAPPVEKPKRFRDIAEYYTGERAQAEIESWGDGTGTTTSNNHMVDAQMVERLCVQYGLSGVVEFCCGSGVMSRLLDVGKIGWYLGLDNCDAFLADAEAKKKPGMMYRKQDIRLFPPLSQPGVLACSFRSLKHFGLHEWDAVIDKVLSYGDVVVVGVNTSAEDHDDGTEFHHSSVSISRLLAAFKRNGVREVERHVGWTGLVAATGRDLAEIVCVCVRERPVVQVPAQVPQPELSPKISEAEGSTDLAQKRPADTGVEYPGLTGITMVGSDTGKSEVVHVGGENPTRQIFADLDKAARLKSIVCVSHYFPRVTTCLTTQAVRWFAITNPGAVVSQTPVSGQPGEYLAFIDRRKGNNLPIGQRHNDSIKICIPAGIGDSAWVITKIPAMLRAMGANTVDIDLPHSDRAKQYLSMLPFVRNVKRCEWDILETPLVNPDGSYNYAQCQPGWHDEYDFFLQANNHLERGQRLEEWFPHMATDWTAPVSFTETVEDKAFGEAFAAKGPYVTLFAGPIEGNTYGGHNRWGKWSQADWVRVVRRLEAAGLRVVLLGNGPGDEEYANTLYAPGFFDMGAEEYVSKWPINHTMAVLRRAVAHCGYQSGLGILSVYFGVPACMFWNEYGFALTDVGITFREEMATAWVPPETLSSGRYFGAIYGRNTPDQVADFLTKFK